MNGLSNRRLVGALVANLVCVSAALAADAVATGQDQDRIARGRYVIAISGCNDCHTPGYPQSGGQVPVEDWLTGDSIGFQGPWGVSYPTNLRLAMDGLTEAQWVSLARAERLPPMPWFSLAHMTDDDLRAIYAFVRALGPKGETAPLAVRPGENVTTPVFYFVPQAQAAAAGSGEPVAERISDATR
jgi:mono/diheme cytochrome c family protein